MPTPRAFKFFKTEDSFFEESLYKMISHNMVWLSLARAFNDPLEMSTFVKRADVHKNSFRIIEDMRKMVADETFSEKRLAQLEQFVPSGDMGRVLKFIDALKENSEFTRAPYSVMSEIANENGSNIVEILSNSMVETANKFADGQYILCMTDNIYNSAMWPITLAIMRVLQLNFIEVLLLLFMQDK